MFTRRLPTYIHRNVRVTWYAQRQKLSLLHYNNVTNVTAEGAARAPNVTLRLASSATARCSPQRTIGLRNAKSTNKTEQEVLYNDVKISSTANVTD